jgi:glucokinase
LRCLLFFGTTLPMDNHFQRLLVGDIGGTNVRFALAEAASDGVCVSHVWKRPGTAFDSFEAALGAFADEVGGSFDGAAIGVAGVVENGRCRLLHRDWAVSTQSVASLIGAARIVMVNDFAALSRAAPHLGAGALRRFWDGAPLAGAPAVVGGPGTGFGLGLLAPLTGGAWRVFSGEGGHQAFAPQTDLEWAVAGRLRAVSGHVSCEGVASGSAFRAVLAAFGDIFGRPVDGLSEEDVRARALAGEELCVSFCRLRAACVMTVLGDAALLINARGGVFIAGGVSRRLAPWLGETQALARFFERGPRVEMMRAMPIDLIDTDDAAFTGAAHLWLDRCREAGEWA